MEDKINNCGCSGKATTSKFQGKTSVYCMECGYSSCEYDTREEAIEKWNIAHPEISNAEKAYNWIRCGKNITHYEQSDFYYVWCQEKGLVLERNKNEKYEKGEGTPVCGSLLFERHWKLYEEPKYSEVDTSHALIQYALQGTNKNILLQFEGREYFIEELVQDSVALATIDEKTGMSKKREDLKGLIWRVYEN